MKMEKRGALQVRPGGISPVVDRRVQAMLAALRDEGIALELSSGPEDTINLLRTDAGIQVVVVDADGAGDLGHCLAAIRQINATVPIFVASTQRDASAFSDQELRDSDEFIWLFEDTDRFIAGRVAAAVERYRRSVLPPMFRGLLEFDSEHEFSWHTPGHTGGTGFLRSPAGRAFFDFFGEQLFRSDLSISVGELGSLLDHSGAIGEGEKYAAGVFGADRTYYVTNGSSTSNRVILMSSVTRGQIALCDRNCHKSVEHAMTMSGAFPVYLRPTRNALGVIGPIPESGLTPAAIKAAIEHNPVRTDAVDPTPVHAIITNSTYDGLCYNVSAIEKILGKSVDRLHFDEAWYGYARFNPIYRGRFAMHGEADAGGEDRPTVFATQSTHKLLSALSQASMIHVRDGRSPVEHLRFNEAFMMHASTSPFYPIIASCDVAAAMMSSDGARLTGESIREAVAFRQSVARRNAAIVKDGGWFFECWQPDKVREGGREVAFHDADPEKLATDPAAWVLRPGAEWHGFEGLTDDWCMLDPIKVSVKTPGLSATGKRGTWGIPAPILSAYLSERGIVVEKTTDFLVLVLFSTGVTRGKWGSLLDALLDFKADFDSNRSLEITHPSLIASTGGRYAGMGLKDLATEMFAATSELGTTEALSAAFSNLPKPDFTPVDAYERLVRNEVERITLDQMGGRTVATGIVPYPPGIPLLMPGENAGPADGPIVAYLKTLQAFDRRFPGFGHDTHGIEAEDGEYYLLAIKN